MFCKHNWIEKSKCYVPTMAEQHITEFSRVSAKILDILQLGQTTFLYECNKCKKHKVIKMFGKILEG